MNAMQFQSCIEACSACADACDFCLSSCLKERDVGAMARCIALDIDCAQLCRIAAAFMARDSERAGAMCTLCAELCNACAAECSQHGMEHCQRCAEACRRCAAECERMAA